MEQIPDQEEDGDHLEPHEVRRAFDRLRAVDILRLTSLARIWARRSDRHDSDELLNEAFKRALEGRRRWPAALPIEVFMSQTMRSIASDWRQRSEREPLFEDDQDRNVATSTSFEHQQESSDLFARMHDALADDLLAAGVYRHILADDGQRAAEEALGIDATVYDTARRRCAAPSSKPSMQDGHHDAARSGRHRPRHDSREHHRGRRRGDCARGRGMRRRHWGANA